ncbi:acyl-CoA thioesterase [Novosphingobium panipatense]
MRAGDTTRPIIYRVLRDFDGGSFANRRVVAMQGGKPILNLAASFHRREEGFAHAAPMPAVPEPEQCPEMVAALTAAGQKLPQAMYERLAPFEVRPGPQATSDTETPRQFLWFRLAAPLGGDDALKRVVVAYASDFALVSTAVLPHTTFFTPGLQVASLDHAVWFHSTPPVEDWLLYVMDSPGPAMRGLRARVDLRPLGPPRGKCSARRALSIGSSFRPESLGAASTRDARAHTGWCWLSAGSRWR